MTTLPQPPAESHPPAGPRVERHVGWGVLSTGKIAHTFTRDLALVPDARLVAVGSRSASPAEAFAAEHAAAGRGTPVRPYASYAELVADPEVDVVYVASPHALHLEHARLALEAGKHVLCEKPLTLTVADAETMVELARRHDRFLMEAMWTACHPLVRVLGEGLRDGRWGTARHLHAELGFVVDAGPDDRMLDPALGASALLDMGVYPVTLAHLLLGEATSLTASASLSERGIDLDAALVGRYPGGALATMTASMTSFSSRRAAIATDRGRIDVEEFHHPTRATFTPYDGSRADRSGPATPQEITADEPVVGRGYGNEVLEVHRCLRAGLRESPLVPHAQTLLIMRQLAGLLDQVGVRHV